MIPKTEPLIVLITLSKLSKLILLTSKFTGLVTKMIVIFQGFVNTEQVDPKLGNKLNFMESDV
jgi:hypothetical protein